MDGAVTRLRSNSISKREDNYDTSTSSRRSAQLTHSSVHDHSIVQSKGIQYTQSVVVYPEVMQTFCATYCISCRSNSPVLHDTVLLPSEVTSSLGSLSGEPCDHDAARRGPKVVCVEKVSVTGHRGRQRIIQQCCRSDSVVPSPSHPKPLRGSLFSRLRFGRIDRTPREHAQVHPHTTLAG